MASLIKQISEINAVCGNEDSLREFILSQITQAQITVDTMGNVIAFKKGSKSNKKIAVITHMDESGFIVSSITDKGYIKFKPCGNIDINTVISKRVVIGENNIKGVIGMKAIHLQTKDERKNTVPAKNLYIDIGAKNKESALKKVALGDFITFDTQCCELGDIIKGKALSRCGVGTVIEAIKQSYACDMYFVFTAQKEIGMRGADIISRRINPDVIITVDTAATDDVFGNDKKTVSLGSGTVIPSLDKYAIYNNELLELAVSTAKKHNIKYQRAVLKNEFSDSGAIQTGAEGVQCINLSIPCRYAKTPVEMVNKNDLKSASELLDELIKEIEEI